MSYLLDNLAGVSASPRDAMSPALLFPRQRQGGYDEMVDVAR